MLKPVTILALDDSAASLAQATHERVAKALDLDDLVQWRRVDGEIDGAIREIRARRQRPDSPLLFRDDLSARELVLIMASAAGPEHASLVETVARVRQAYESRRLAAFFSIEIVCLMPDLTNSEDHAATYAVLKCLSAAEPKPFGEVWLLDATNGGRVQFGALANSLEIYADALAGSLLFEAELSGALPGYRPRGSPPTFSAFGYAELFFPRDLVLQRVESRFAAELVERVLLAGKPADGGEVLLQCKRFLGTAGLPWDSPQSHFRRFQPKALAGERTRSAEEVIGAVRNELKVFRDSVHLQGLEELATQGERAAASAMARFDLAVDELLDRSGFPSALGFLEALLDPLPDLRPDADASPRNLVTDLGAANAALDARVRFIPNTTGSDTVRKRVRELATRVNDQKQAADTLSPGTATEQIDEQIDELEREQRSLVERLPELVFAEEAANSAGRAAARDAEAARLAGETLAREQELRELFTQRPRAEQALREALENRRAWSGRQLFFLALTLAVIYAVPYGLGILSSHFREVTWFAATSVGLIAFVSTIRYVNDIAPAVRAARETVARIRSRIEPTDRAKNVAHDDELQFEYEVARRRMAVQVLRKLREHAAKTLDQLRERFQVLGDLTRNDGLLSIVGSGLTVSIIDDKDADAWYQRTADDRKTSIREFPISRSLARHLAPEELRRRVAEHAASAFPQLREMTLARAASEVATESKLAQRLNRLVDLSAPLVDVRDDDLPAQQLMQRDVTIWCETGDALWTTTLQRRFPEAHLKEAPGELRVHILARVLHFPAYVLGQIDFLRSSYESSDMREFADMPDLIPADLLVTGPLRLAYEQVLLGRALGVIEARGDGTLAADGAALGESNRAAADHLVAATGKAARERLQEALAPRLAIPREVERHLRVLLESTPLTTLDRGIVDALVRRYGLA